MRFTRCTRALTSQRPCRFPCALRRHARIVTTRRYLHGNQLSGTFPTEVGLMTALRVMCVHTCCRAIASFRRITTRTAIHPLYTRAHFPTPVSLPLRSPMARSICGDTQGLEGQRDYGSDPHRGRTDDGAIGNVRAHVPPRNRLFSGVSQRALRFTCCTRALTSPRACRFPCALRRHARFVATRRNLNVGQLSGPIPTEVGLMAALTFLCVHERAPPCNGPFPGVRIHTAIYPPKRARSLPHARVASPALSDATLALWRHAGS